MCRTLIRTEGITNLIVTCLFQVDISDLIEFGSEWNIFIVDILICHGRLSTGESYLVQDCSFPSRASVRHDHVPTFTTPAK